MTATRNTNTRTLTAWQLWQMLPVHAASLGVSDIEVWHWLDDDDRSAGMSRAVVGYDFVGADVEVWHGERLVWAIKDYGWCGIELSYERAQPMGDVGMVERGCKLTVREVSH